LTILRHGCARGRLIPLLSVFVAAIGVAGCVAGYALVPRNAAELGPRSGADAITWFGPAAASDARTLARWRSSVGPPILLRPRDRTPGVVDEITIVSWNTALGAADVTGFVHSLPNPGGPLVLLLQEVYRGGPEVPTQLVRGRSFARRHGGATHGHESREIKAMADALGFAVYYVPSMRNGGPLSSDEDRGNAILSNLPLESPTAVELPFEHQRRVAIAATLAGQTKGGAPWRLRVVSVHLDNTGSAKHAWVAAEFGRARQARGLTDLLRDDQPTIVAGDFNTWFGYRDQAYVETARAFPGTPVVDRRPTFRGLLRLDHMFFRLPPGWSAGFRRAARRFGSDHYPLVGMLRFV
jgi:endonuclease/exonuclease/phosphatase family metal-dependent hydrolase